MATVTLIRPEVGNAYNADMLAVLIAGLRTLAVDPAVRCLVVRGACFGGGVGVVCCVDVALATPDSRFGIIEVRVGVAPTPISTYLVGAIGLRHTRRYALTGKRVPGWHWGQVRE